MQLLQLLSKLSFHLNFIIKKGTFKTKPNDDNLNEIGS